MFHAGIEQFKGSCRLAPADLYHNVEYSIVLKKTCVNVNTNVVEKTTMLAYTATQFRMHISRNLRDKARNFSEIRALLWNLSEKHAVKPFFGHRIVLKCKRQVRQAVVPVYKSDAVDNNLHAIVCDNPFANPLVIIHCLLRVTEMPYQYGAPFLIHITFGN